jgi:ferritin-like metal-binding protein YciE
MNYAPLSKSTTRKPKVKLSGLSRFSNCSARARQEVRRHRSILDEGTEIMDECKGESALDAGLLAAAQAVERYEISRYGTLKSWATKLGMKDAVKLLDQTLSEEKKTDDALTKLADTAVNAEAA